MRKVFVFIGYFLLIVLSNSLDLDFINSEDYKEPREFSYESIGIIETTIEQNIQEIYEIETEITPEKLIAEMVECENKQNWDQYWSYWESSSQSYWKNVFQDEEFIRSSFGVTTVRSANLLGIGEVGLEYIAPSIRNSGIYKDITSWKAYLVAVDYTVEKISNAWYNGVAYSMIAVGKEKGEWRIIEVSEVELGELHKLYLDCLGGKALFEWLKEEDLNIAVKIRDARTQGILLDGDLSVVKNISSNPNAIENYLSKKRGYPNKNWRYINENWHYMDDNGELVKGKWYSIDGKQYYFDEDGNGVTGWLYLSGKWYYFGLDGVMWHDKWVEDTNRSDIWYYCDSNGEMLIDTSKVLYGKTYYFNVDGVCLNP